MEYGSLMEETRAKGRYSVFPGVDLRFLYGCLKWLSSNVPRSFLLPLYLAMYLSIDFHSISRISTQGRMLEISDFPSGMVKI